MDDIVARSLSGGVARGQAGEILSDGEIGETRMLGLSARTLVVLASLLWGTIYLLFGSENYIYADDSLRFALYVDRSPHVIVHHLIIGILYFLEKFLNPFSAGMDGTITFIRLYVAASSVLALTMVGILTLRWFGSARAALLALTAVAVTYGFWSYSIITDFYVPAVAFVLAALYFADRACVESRYWIPVVLAALSVLISSFNHQAHALVVLPITLVLLFAQRREIPAGLRWRRALLFFGATGLLGLVGFYLGYLGSEDANFIDFVRGYSGWMMLTPYDKLQILTPVYTLVGIGRTIFFPEILLGIDSIFDAAHKAFLLKVLIDDLYLVRDFPVALIVATGALMVGVSLLIALGIVRAIQVVRRYGVRHPGYWMTLYWAAAQFAMFCWWEPISNEFWIWMMPALALLIVGPLYLYGSRRSRLLQMIAVGGLLLANLPVISRYWSAGNDIYWINKSHAPLVRPTDLVLTSNFYQTSSMDMVRMGTIRRYELPVGAFSSGEPRLRSMIDTVRAAGGAIFLDPMLAMPDATEIAMRKYYSKGKGAGAEEELQQLEKFCSDNAIPIYAITRRGGDEVPFVTRKFGGYLRWVAPDANRDSLDRTNAKLEGTGR